MNIVLQVRRLALGILALAGMATSASSASTVIDGFDGFWESIKNGGPPVILLLLAALYWMNRERLRLIVRLEAQIERTEAKSVKLENLSERTATILAEIRTLLFNRRSK